ncbi:MAG TPA: VOC family protein [Thermoplasmata archaeon]|nr:VOC family protein [Thermoplasmata archaeon]
MAAEANRPGPKPKRLYVRLVRFGDPDRDDLPAPRAVRAFVEELDRVGRLVARGPLTEPAGDAVILRAVDLAEANRVLRTDPFRSLTGSSYEVVAWNPESVGAGVNLEPPPARGAGRLTRLQRISVVVRDQASSLRWYRDVLGLAVREHDLETGHVELSLGKGAVAVSLVSPKLEWGEPYFSEGTARIGTRTGIAFETDSVPALELRLRHAGSTITQAPQSEPWGGVTIRFTDPDGNEFLAFSKSELPEGSEPGPYAPRPRKTH